MKREKRSKPSGRPANGFAALLTGLRKDPAVHAAIRAAASDSTNRGFATVMKVLTDYDDQKPAEKHQVAGALTVRVVIVEEGRRVTSS